MKEIWNNMNVSKSQSLFYRRKNSEFFFPKVSIERESREFSQFCEPPLQRGRTRNFSKSQSLQKRIFLKKLANKPESTPSNGKTLLCTKICTQMQKIDSKMETEQVRYMAKMEMNTFLRKLDMPFSSITTKYSAKSEILDIKSKITNNSLQPICS